MTRCARCNDPIELRTAEQRHCVRCTAEVAAIVAADQKRRTRFRFAKELSRETAA